MLKWMFWIFGSLAVLSVVCGILGEILKAVERSKKAAEAAKREAEHRAYMAAQKNDLRNFADELMAACAKEEKSSWGQMTEDFAQGRASFRITAFDLQYRKVGALTHHLHYSKLGVSLTAQGGLSQQEKLECIADRIAEEIPVETEFRYNWGRYQTANPKANTYTTTTEFKTVGTAVRSVHATTKEADTISHEYLKEIEIIAKNRPSEAEAPKIKKL